MESGERRPGPGMTGIITVELTTFVDFFVQYSWDQIHAEYSIMGSGIAEAVLNSSIY